MKKGIYAALAAMVVIAAMLFFLTGCGEMSTAPGQDVVTGQTTAGEYPYAGLINKDSLQLVFNQLKAEAELTKEVDGSYPLTAYLMVLDKSGKQAAEFRVYQFQSYSCAQMIHAFTGVKGEQQPVYVSVASSIFCDIVGGGDLNLKTKTAGNVKLSFLTAVSEELTAVILNTGLLTFNQAALDTMGIKKGTRILIAVNEMVSNDRGLYLKVLGDKDKANPEQVFEFADYGSHNRHFKTRGLMKQLEYDFKEKKISFAIEKLDYEGELIWALKYSEAPRKKMKTV